jgi:hypothetical protein
MTHDGPERSCTSGFSPTDRPFPMDDFDMALPRARRLVPRLEEEPHRNPNTGTIEFSLRDPDVYFVTLSALSAA